MAQATENFALTDRDLKTLAVVHPKLEAIVKAAAKETEMPFMVFEGVRTAARQKMLYKKGASKTLKSRHLTGHAVDLVPLIDGKPVWDVPGTMVIAAAMFKAADDLGMRGKMRWGGDWDMDGDYYDSKFYDGPHFELRSQNFPAKNPAKRTKEYLAKLKGGAYNQTRTNPSKYEGTHKTAFAATVQQALNYMGITVKVDGYYGEDTRAGVSIAQGTILGVHADGLWGPDTGDAYRAWAKEKDEADKAAAEERAVLRAEQQRKDKERAALRAEQQRKDKERQAAEAKAAAEASRDSGVVSDDKSTRPFAGREQTIDREAERELDRNVTPDQPAYKQGGADDGEGGGFPTGVVLIALLLIVAVIVYGSVTS